MPTFSRHRQRATYTAHTAALAEAARPIFQVHNTEALTVTLDVTAASGTPTLDISLEYSQRKDGPWAAPASAQAMTQATGVGTEVKRFVPEGRFVRIVDAVGGTTPLFDATIDVSS